MSGFTRLSMKSKYVCRGFIRLYVHFHNNAIKWSTNLHVKIRRWGGRKKSLTNLRRLSAHLLVPRPGNQRTNEVYARDLVSLILILKNGTTKSNVRDNRNCWQLLETVNCAFGDKNGDEEVEIRLFGGLSAGIAK